MSAKKSQPRSILRFPSQSESEGWHLGLTNTPVDLRRLQEIKDLVLGGGSTGYAAMDRIVLEGAQQVPLFEPSNLQRADPFPQSQLLNTGTNNQM